MRIYLSTFIDAPDNADIQDVTERAVGWIAVRLVHDSIPGDSMQLLNNLQFNFSDNGDRG